MTTYSDLRDLIAFYDNLGHKPPIYQLAQQILKSDLKYWLNPQIQEITNLYWKLPEREEIENWAHEKAIREEILTMQTPRDICPDTAEQARLWELTDHITRQWREYASDKFIVQEQWRQH